MLGSPPRPLTAFLAGADRSAWRRAMVRLVEQGTAGHPLKVRRRLKTLNVMAALIAVFSLIFALTYAAEDPRAHRGPILINLALAGAALLVPRAHRLHPLAGAWIVVVAESAGLFGLVALMGREAGIQLNLVVGAAAAFVILGVERLRLVLAVVALALAVHLLAWFAFPAGLAPASPAFQAQLYVSSALTAFGVIAALVWYAFALAERAEAESEALLRGILPGPIVERLREAPGVPIADSVPEASVLFADLKGFVALSRALGAAGTVILLNDLIRAFDRLASAHGVEKIKTIGDCYMAVAGLPEPCPDHAERLARFALALGPAARATAAAHGVALDLRVGMAVGPVMAGVIGERKFTYDVWGEPVNLAARLENAGEVGRIHLCAALAGRLAEAFELAPRGTLEIKGMGPQETFFLLGPRPARAAEAA